MADDHSAGEPLLQNLTDAENGNPPHSVFATAFIKWVLGVAMWLVLGFWVAVFFLFPSDAGTQFVESWTRATMGNVFGVTGSAIFISARS